MTVLDDNILAVLQERAALFENEGKGLADIASTRAFSAEEQERANKVDAQFDALDARLNLLNKSKAAASAVDNFREALSTRGSDVDLAAELRGLLTQRDHDPVAAKFTDAEFTRALSVGTASAGGNTVPKLFLDYLAESLRQFSPLWEAGATPFVTETGADVTLPRLAGFGAAAAVTEGTQIGGTDPSFAQVTFKAYKYGDFRGISKELVEDSIVDIERLVGRLIGENIGYLFGQKLSVGVGTTEPLGIITAATVGKTGATGVGGAFTFDDLIDLQESLLAPYHINSSWLLANTAMATARKIKDTTNQYIWQPSTQIGQPDQLFGRPVYRDPYMSGVGLGAKSVGYGDVSRYWIRTVGETRVERSDHALFGSDQIAFKGVLRGDGNLLDLSAFKTFQGGAS